MIVDLISSHVHKYMPHYYAPRLALVSVPPFGLVFAAVSTYLRLVVLIITRVHTCMHAPPEFTCGSQRTTLEMLLPLLLHIPQLPLSPVSLFCWYFLLTGLSKRACHERQELSSISAHAGCWPSCSGSRTAYWFLRSPLRSGDWR